jgi:hypothetical protein
MEDPRPPIGIPEFSGNRIPVPFRDHMYITYKMVELRIAFDQSITSLSRKFLFHLIIVKKK